MGLMFLDTKPPHAEAAARLEVLHVVVQVALDPAGDLRAQDGHQLQTHGPDPRIQAPNLAKPELEKIWGVVGRTGFEPVKAEPTDLQSVPFGRLGISPP